MIPPPLLLPPSSQQANPLSFLDEPDPLTQRTEEDAANPLGFLDSAQRRTAPRVPTSYNTLRGAATTGLSARRPGYSPGRMPKDITTLFVALGGVVAAILLIGFWANLSKIGGDGTGHGNAESAIRVSPMELVEQYATNEVAADQAYKGRLLEVTGTATRIGKDFLDNRYVTLDGGNVLREIQCFFETEHNNELAAIQTGRTVTIRGRCDGLMGNVGLKDCRFVK
jgi:hypothetical protein